IETAANDAHVDVRRFPLPFDRIPYFETFQTHVGGVRPPELVIPVIESEIIGGGIPSRHPGAGGVKDIFMMPAVHEHGQAVPAPGQRRTTLCEMLKHYTL